MGNRIENQYEVLEGILAGVKKPRDLPLALLEDITKHFSEERKIGEGGFGMVYKGLLRNGEMVAVKKILQAIPSSQTQFENEVNLLMKLKHQNIVRLVGYCYETRHLHMSYKGKSVFAWDTESLLCLEYLPNGSLDKYISDASSGLNWHTRSKIIEGISYGLQYLHENSNEPIIHLDLKPANILLDAKMLPKITDFGLSRLFDQNKTIDTATIRGTLGYMSPEFLRGTITPMSDIFSLGVIIMEVITGHRDYPYDIRKSSEDFIVLELKKWRNRLQKEPVYTSLETDCQRIERCIQIGLICVNPERTKRPTMKKIIDMLERFESMNLYNETSCSVEQTNDTSNSIAVNIQTTSKQYTPQPDKGIVLPGHKPGVKRTLQPEESTTKVRNADKFIMQSTKAKGVLADEDSIDHMFSSKKVVDEVHLMVVYKPEKYQVDLSLDRQEEEVPKRSSPTRLSMQLMEYGHEKPEVTAVSMDPNFSSYLYDYYLSSVSDTKFSDDVFLQRNKRKLGSSDDIQASLEVMDGFRVTNGLAHKISSKSSKASYVLDTEDFLFRVRNRRRVPAGITAPCKADMVKAQRFHRFLSRP